MERLIEIFGIKINIDFTNKLFIFICVFYTIIIIYSTYSSFNGSSINPFSDIERSNSGGSGSRTSSHYYHK